MIEEEDLRAAFARHESLTPDAGPLRLAIDRVATRRRRRRNGIRAGAAALVVLAGLTIGVPLMRQPAEGVPVDLIGGGGRSSAPATTDPLPAGAWNLLLIGIDGARADSITIVHIPADRSRPYLVSVPRDIVVPIPGHGEGKINRSFEYGGGAKSLAEGGTATAQAVSKLTGTKIDSTAVVTYAGLRSAVDALGGVEICLSQKVKSVHTHRTYPAGCSRYAARDTQDLLRQRYGLTDGATDRERNMQRFLAGMVRAIAADKVTDDPAKALKLLNAVGGGLVMDLGGASPATLAELPRQLGSTEPVGVTVPFTDYDQPGRNSRGHGPLTDSLFTALREDRLAEWATAHPDRVTVQR